MAVARKAQSVKREKQQVQHQMEHQQQELVENYLQGDPCDALKGSWLPAKPGSGILLDQSLDVCFVPIVVSLLW